MIKRYLVTGCRGFVGRWMVHHLANLEDQDTLVFGTDIAGAMPVDLTDLCAVRRLVDICRPTHVVHCAGLTTGPRSALATANVVATGVLCRVLYKLTTKPKLVVTSSAAVYGEVQQAECPIMESRPVAPVGGYAESKVDQEWIANDSGVRPIIARIFNLSGPGQAGHLMPTALFHTLDSLPPGGPLPLRNAGSVRDWCDVRDAVGALQVLAESGQPGQAYNVGCGMPTTTAELAHLVLNVMGDARAIMEERGTGGWSVADTTRVKALGWQPTISLHTSLVDGLAAYRRGGVLTPWNRTGIMAP